jgi:amino acid permease
MSVKDEMGGFVGVLIGFLFGALLTCITFLKIYYLLVAILPICIIYVLNAAHITDFREKWNHLKIEVKYKSLKFFFISCVFIGYMITILMSESHFSFDPKVESSIVRCSSLLGFIGILIIYSVWRLGEEDKKVRYFKEHLRKPE